jgi:hypothetical protein
VRCRSMACAVHSSQRTAVHVQLTA